MARGRKWFRIELLAGWLVVTYPSLKFSDRVHTKCVKDFKNRSFDRCLPACLNAVVLCCAELALPLSLTGFASAASLAVQKWPKRSVW